MNTIQKGLNHEQCEKLLRNIWILHEARWFVKVAMEYGFEAATKLNLAVAKSISKTEIKQLLPEIEIVPIKNMSDFDRFMHIAADLYFPIEHKYEMGIVSDTIYSGKVLDCYVYKNISKAGTTAIHQCAATYRFNSWLEALGLKGKATSDQNTCTCNGKCEILFHLSWD